MKKKEDMCKVKYKNVSEKRKKDIVSKDYNSIIISDNNLK